MTFVIKLMAFDRVLRCVKFDKKYMLEKIEPKKLITHHFKLDEMLHAYEVFGNASEEKAMKVILTNAQ